MSLSVSLRINAVNVRSISLCIPVTNLGTDTGRKALAPGVEVFSFTRDNSDSQFLRGSVFHLFLRLPLVLPAGHGDGRHQPCHQSSTRTMTVHRRRARPAALLHGNCLTAASTTATAPVVRMASVPSIVSFREHSTMLPLEGVLHGRQQGRLGEDKCRRIVAAVGTH